MEFFSKMSLGSSFVIEEGSVIAYTLRDGNVSFADVILIGEVTAGAAASIAIAFLAGGTSLRFKIRDGEHQGAPDILSNARRPRSRRHSVRRGG